MKNHVSFTKTELGRLRDNIRRTNEKLAAFQAEHQAAERQILSEILDDLAERRPDLKDVKLALTQDKDGSFVGVEWESAEKKDEATRNGAERPHLEVVK